MVTAMNDILYSRSMTDVYSFCSLPVLPSSPSRDERKRNRMATKCCETFSLDSSVCGMTRSSWFWVKEQLVSVG